MPLEFASLTNLDTNDVCHALFNPNEYSINKDNNYAQMAVPGLGSPLLQFVHGNLKTLDMELFFDSYEQHLHGSLVVNQPQDDVRKLTQPVVDLLEINPDTHAPPKVLFLWGGLKFKGVLAKVAQRFTMFLDNGIPIRARLSVTFNELKTASEEAKEVKRQTADFTRAHTVGDGETLSSIAASIYKDATKWRPIAIANRLEDPRQLPTGLLLSVPPLPYRDPDSGRVYT
jgi:hypothetical protein